MMKCPACNGTGLVYNALGDFEEDCGYCHGTGNVAEPLTNEEWFCGLSTAEKAKWMAKHMSFCEVCEIQTCRGDGCQRFDRGSMTETDAFREWLKEKHI